jgi:hypothetical protein
MADEPTVPDRPSEHHSGGYEPPRIEKVLTPQDLEREVQYAGFQVSRPS